MCLARDNINKFYNIILLRVTLVWKIIRSGWPDPKIDKNGIFYGKKKKTNQPTEKLHFIQIIKTPCEYLEKKKHWSRCSTVESFLKLVFVQFWFLHS